MGLGPREMRRTVLYPVVDALAKPWLAQMVSTMASGGQGSNHVHLSTKIFVDTTNIFVVCSCSMKQPPHKPTASELEILRVLWIRGPSTVREVHESLSEKKELGYTTVLKLLQIMTAKGTVRRNETQRAHVYEACLPAEHTKRQLAGDMLQRVFEGSASQLMMHALAGGKASREEIKELRGMLDEYEKNERKRP
jgi:BlaI family penicillinase repressor